MCLHISATLWLLFRERHPEWQKWKNLATNLNSSINNVNHLITILMDKFIHMRCHCFSLVKLLAENGGLISKPYINASNKFTCNPLNRSLFYCMFTGDTQSTFSGWYFTLFTFQFILIIRAFWPFSNVLYEN